MAANDYHFITRWRFPASRHDVADVIGDVHGLTRWWPSVYLDVREIEPGEPSGVGKVLDLYTRGWLPYTLRWRFTVIESDYPGTLAIRAAGDFSGEGRWTFTQHGRFTDVVYDWRIRANKPLLRYLSWLLRPVFAANHRWAMEQGRKSVELELARRTAPTLEDRLAVPEPPGQAASVRSLSLALGAFLGATALSVAWQRRFRTKHSAGR